MAEGQHSATQLLDDDTERAGLSGRTSGVSRRGFLESGLAAMTAAIGGPVVLANALSGGLIPAARAQEAKSSASPAPAPAGPQPLQFPGKDSGLVLLGD